MVPEEAAQIVSGKSNMSKRYAAEFKRDAIALVRSSPHRNVTEIARELGVSPEGLRGWAKQDRTDRGEGPAGALTSDEREELRRIRRELAEVKKANEILVKAAVQSTRHRNIPGDGGCDAWRGWGVRACRTHRS
ncbi:transposase, partial [Kitasatospora sp. NPDC004669]|uniref:transposase n=1 Tax=Kitasatospora sp. NPDC004669 TaxID=3154555 RepID=UPI00339FEA9C